MVREVERLRAAALTKAMNECPACHVEEEYIQAVLCFPGPNSGIPSVHFSEQLLALLAVP